MKTFSQKYILGVIGGGFMAHAIVNGAIASHFLPAEKIIVSEPDGEKRASFEKAGVIAVCDNGAVAESCDYLLIAVKPQTFLQIAPELKSQALPVVVSIMAGKAISSIRQSLGAQKIARIMPNLPCSIGEGIAAIATENLSDAQSQFVFSLFNAVGKTVAVEEEKLDAVTGISGSGPAYVYLFLKSLVEAGVKQGLTEEQAKSLALQTVKGGAAMAESSTRSLDELIAAVSSKGGTTVAALESFASDDFAGTVERAVNACVRRAEELSK